MATSTDAVEEKLRLSTQNLLDHANTISSALDGADAAKWGLREEWEPFLKDSLNLALQLDKLGKGKLARARSGREASSRSEPPRTPQDATHLSVKIIKAAPIKDAKSYAALESMLEQAEEYEVVRVRDHQMGITRLTETPKTVRRAYYNGMSFANFDIKRYVFAQGGPYPRCDSCPCSYSHTRPLLFHTCVCVAVSALSGRLASHLMTHETRPHLRMPAATPPRWCHQR